MFAKTIDKDILEHRLDSWFYNPRAIHATNVLMKSLPISRLSELIDPSRKITNGVRGPEWEDTKYKLIRLQDCENWIVNHAKASSISHRQFNENKRCVLRVDDIVVAIGGYVGNASVVVDGCFAVIGQHSALLSSNPMGGFDSRYLLAYLNSSYAEAIFDRYVSGTVQAGVNLEDLRELPAPVPEYFAQKYIGDKVRQAERQRTRATDLSTAIAALLSDFNSEHIEQGRTSRVRSEDLWNTINANSYMPQYMAALEKTKQYECHSIASLSKVVADGPFGSNLKVDDYLSEQHGRHPIVRVKNCKDGELDTSDLAWISTTKQQELIRSEVKANDLLVTKAGRIGSTAVYPEGLPNGNITSHLIRARLKTISPYYVAAFLETRVGRLLTEQHSFKSTRPELTKVEIEACLVPILDESLMSEVDLAARQKYSANSMAKLLVTASKLIVEALIEGKIGESHLVAAQQGLESGDNSLDRDILTRLRTDGLDGKGEPLFPDLDHLYDLLDQAKRALAE